MQMTIVDLRGMQISRFDAMCNNYCENTVHCAFSGKMDRTCLKVFNLNFSFFKNDKINMLRVVTSSYYVQHLIIIVCSIWYYNTIIK